MAERYAGRSGVVGGVQEAFIGVRDPVAAIRHWERFGYRVGPAGQLAADAARTLYGVDSPLHSVRLLHQDADQGLLRLMVWDRPAGPGLGTGPWRVQGNRWLACLTDDILNIANHAEVLRAQGGPIGFVDPVHVPPQRPEAALRPFDQPVPATRQMTLTQPLWRLLCVQIFSGSGRAQPTINPACLMRTGPAMHFGMVIQDDRPEILEFYDRTLGLQRATDQSLPYDPSRGAPRLLDLREGEWHGLVDFDAAVAATDPAPVRAARLRVLRFRSASALPDARRESRPGQLGLSGYCLRVHGLAALRERIAAAGAGEVTPVVEDEFGRPACAFVAPDGYHWTAFEA
ncbi:VOC family protein [Rhodospirillum centenum]|uniref:Glyoxalase family protein n=1 Tax=Rhodospirillum centenum (strain ATCC 51521 / SW) TaxID=414684 RepID=B6IRZ3_RHOCS|nr:glyoxalase/bleomycin resistance/dioxygenase family protein [Rhodospirillum centenum]ACI98229.1 conserved hypothetical protein [Rhodospirillum centenum SW]